MALPDAEKKLAGIQADRGAVAREGRLADYMGDLNDELDRQHKARMGARARRLGSALAAGADGGRYSPITMDRMRGELEYIRGGGITGLRQHELDVLKQQGDNDFRVAEQKRFGMREQGSDAAGLNAEATKYGWDKQLEMEEKRQNGLTKREKMIGNRTERIAGMEHGTVGPDGKVIPGSRERVAGINAEAVALQAELKRQHELELDQEKTQRTIDTNNTRKEVGAGHDQARRDAAGLQQQRADQNARTRIVQDIQKGAYLTSGMTPEKWKSLSPEEQQAYINGLMPNRQNNNNQQPPTRRSWRDRYEAANK